MSLFVLLLLLSLLGSAEGFFARFPVARSCCRHGAAATQEDGIILNSSRLDPGDEAPLLAINETLRVDVSTLAERKQPPSPYQIRRPRWYSKTEVAIIVLLCQRLRMLDLKGVERMLDAQKKSFAKEDPRDVRERALFLKAAAPEANFRTVIRRHPRTLLVPVHKMERVLNILREAYPDANLARVLERIPSALSRNATKLEENVAGLKRYAPEVDCSIFQAAPSMIFLPPHTAKEKVAVLRSCLPGINLYTFLKGVPTALGRSKETVPRCLSQLRERFPKATTRELVRIVESAPSLVRMSGANGTLSVKVDHLMALLPGVNVTTIISNAPGVFTHSGPSLPAKVENLQELFPSANVTKMVSRTPGIMYLDVGRTIRPKAEWIQQTVGLDQPGLDRLVEVGPWLLKAGWGPLARLEFAIEGGIASPERPSSIYSLVRKSRVAFARAHYPAYEDFLRRRLEEEEIEGGGKEDGKRGAGSEALHPLAWRPSAVRGEKGRGKGSESAPGAVEAAAGERTVKLEEAGAKLKNVVSTSGDGDGEGEGDRDEEDEEDLMARAALRVAELEDALGRGRKSRLSGAKDRPPHTQRPPLARLQGSPQDGDALLDLGQEEMVAYVDSLAQQRRLGA